jgi:putative SOS response-associated peptidase YedK
MCGRFGSSFDGADLKDNFDLEKTPGLKIKPNYNTAPSQLIVGITKNSPLVAHLMHWGFIPSWADPGKSKFRPINARADKIKSSGFYKADFTKNRCLIPASWFYEWKRTIVDGEEVKQPYLIKVKGKELFAFAGIYSKHMDAEDKEHFFAAIVTTKPNKVMKSIHNRMPVIIEEKDYEKYLDGEESDAHKLLVPFKGKLETWRVSTKVGNPENNNKDLIKPLED